MQTLIGILAIIIAVGSVIFAAIQTRILASQTEGSPNNRRIVIQPRNHCSHE